MARRAVTGFTLIEVLLAMAVASLVVLTGFMAYDYIMQNWQRGQRQFQQTKQDFMQQQLIQQALRNTELKLVYPRELQRRASAELPGFYFLGREEGYTAVTRLSVQDPAYPAVYRLFREQDAENPGTWRLVYEEAMLKGFILQHAEQELPFNFRRVMLSNLSQVQFAYQGWASLQQKMAAFSEFAIAVPPQEWLTNYDGMQSRLHPLTVRISFDSIHWQFSFEDNAAELLQQLSSEL